MNHVHIQFMLIVNEHAGAHLYTVVTDGAVGAPWWPVEAAG